MKHLSIGFFSSMIGNKRGEKSDRTEKGDVMTPLLKFSIMRQRKIEETSIKWHAMTRRNQKSRIIQHA